MGVVEMQRGVWEDVMHMGTGETDALKTRDVLRYGSDGDAKGSVRRCDAYELGWAENARFLIKFWILQTLGEILLIYRKKGILPNFQLFSNIFLTVHTPIENFFLSTIEDKKTTNTIKGEKLLWNETK